MSDEEQILGFDVREMRSQMDATWSPHRKETFLLRTDVSKVLSVDSHVWPRVLEVDRNMRAPTQYRDLGLWETLQLLREYLQQNWDAVQRPYRVIGITLLRDALTIQEQPMWDALLATTAPASLNKEWAFLGYDIADEGFISGLSNCGYEISELHLRNGWRPYLNEWHLFTEREQAIKFKRMTDQRVVEHAPFCVYALYSLIHP